MPYYDRIGVSQGNGVKNTTASKECIIFYHWYFFDKGFKFQPDVCDGGHDVLMMSGTITNIAILNIWGVVYCCIINEISRSVGVTLLQIADLSKKVEHYEI